VRRRRVAGSLDGRGQWLVTESRPIGPRLGSGYPGLRAAPISAGLGLASQSGEGLGGEDHFHRNLEIFGDPQREKQARAVFASFLKGAPDTDGKDWRW
jgi:hypothetical protein